jgi:hypothetical protein
MRANSLFESPSGLLISDLSMNNIAELLGFPRRIRDQQVARPYSAAARRVGATIERPTSLPLDRNIIGADLFPR